VGEDPGGGSGLRDRFEDPPAPSAARAAQDDFLVSRDGEAWFLVEAKTSAGGGLSPALSRFQAQTGAAHAFQAVLDLPWVERDLFSIHEPVVVPARTLLSQLV
jgi:hypothetical protein